MPNVFHRSAAAVLALSLSACASAPEEARLTAAAPTGAEHLITTCRDSALAGRAAQAELDRSRSVNLGKTVAGHLAKGALGTWDPFLQIAAVTLGAAYGTAAAVVDSGLRAANRQVQSTHTFAGCVESGKAAPAAAPQDPGIASPTPRATDEGAAQLRDLGLQPPIP